ncbi:MAG TPA: LytTR family DNA-binding domain-containing protein [Flavisolibacter sp.]|jgi:DNA-binding LytR/AlgR family response regulator|nr:LytTR family DNA-binding domain-containing protein [Flavisolibacter sp.]
MKIRCLLIDDEPPALRVLQSHITKIGGLEVVGACSNAVEAIEVLHRKTVDVMFLDIKMPKILGTDFLRSLSHPPRVIFVTAYRDYAVEGFELDAVDYLVKPVSFERFLKAVNRLRRSADTPPPDEQELYAPNPNAFVYVKADRTMQKIILNDILYIESWKDYVKLFFTNGKYLLVKQPISAIESLLSVHKFLRVHRSYIVSLNKISGYNSTTIKLSSTDIPIGRLYKQSVMNQLTV